MALTARERVLTALNHEEPDRVPIDLGGTQTGISVQTYGPLKRLLGISTPTAVSNVIMDLAKIEEEVLDRFQIDFRHVLPQPPSTWQMNLEPGNYFMDEWQVKWHRPPESNYYDLAGQPLTTATIDDLDKYPWPDPEDPGRTAGMVEHIKSISRNGEYAVAAGLQGPFEMCWILRGMEQWFVDLLTDPEFTAALFDRVADVITRMHVAFLKETGPYLDVVKLWDDFGTQNSLLISPKIFRNIIKPREAALIQEIKKYTNAKIAIHSCGSIYPILGDLAEIGIEVINPVQVRAKDMEPARLKREFGDKLSFWGGVDTQHTLPFGSPADVEAEVKERIRELGPGGGYILASVHNIQADVPPENIIAMYDTALSVGKYPLPTTLP